MSITGNSEIESIFVVVSLARDVEEKSGIVTKKFLFKIKSVIAYTYIIYCKWISMNYVSIKLFLRLYDSIYIA